MPRCTITRIGKFGVVLLLFWIALLVCMTNTFYSWTDTNQLIYNRRCFTAQKVVNHKNKKQANMSYTELGFQSEDGRRPMSCNNCFTPQINFVIMNKDACESSNDIMLVVLVVSNPVNTYSRASVRHSWASISNRNTSPLFRVVFLLGQHPDQRITECVSEESKKYGDIIQGGFQDIYAHLTLKTLMGFMWVREFCPNARYVLKTDDDVLVQPIKLLNVLLTENFQNSVIGNCFQYEPHRGNWSKWSIHPSMYPDDYPRITVCSGTAYLTTLPVINNILNASPDVPFFPLEDVYIGLCLHHLENVRYVNHPRISMTGFYHMPTRAFNIMKFLCNCVLTAHGVDILNKWRDMLKARCVYTLDEIMPGAYCQVVEQRFRPDKNVTFTT